MGTSPALSDIKPADFVRKEFEGVLSTFVPVGEQALDPMSDYFGDAYSRTIFHVARGRVHWFWPREDMIRLRDSFMAQCMDDPSHARKVCRDWLDRSESFRSKANALAFRPLRKDDGVDDEELIHLHDRFYESYVRQYALAIGIQDAFSMLAGELDTQRMLALIEGHAGGADASEMLQALTYPDYLSFTSRFEDRLLSLEALVRRDPELSQLMIQQNVLQSLADALDAQASAGEAVGEVVARFWWIANSYRKARVLPAIYFILRLQEQMRRHPGRDVEDVIRARQDRHSTAVDRMRSVEADDRLPPEVRVWASISRLFTEMQDERKQNVLMACGVFARMRAELSRRRPTHRRYDLDSMLPREFASVLRNGVPSFDVLAAREEGVVCLQQRGGDLRLIDDREVALTWLNALQGEVDAGQVRLTGSAGSSGRASGPAFVLDADAEPSMTPKGAVLVASMTRPEHTPAMMVASAVVTDEGGITSHAVTVCRELSIPCVVGTQSATRVIQTGEPLDVDGDRGLVVRTSLASGGSTDDESG